MHRRSIITTIGVAVVVHVLAITAYLAGTDRLQAFLTALTSVYTGPPSPEFVEGTINHRHSLRLINLRLPLLRRHRRTKIKWKFFHGWMNPVFGGFPNVEYKIDFEKRLIRWRL